MPDLSSLQGWWVVSAVPIEPVGSESGAQQASLGQLLKFSEAHGCTVAAPVERKPAGKRSRGCGRLDRTGSGQATCTARKCPFTPDALVPGKGLSGLGCLGCGWCPGPLEAEGKDGGGREMASTGGRTAPASCGWETSFAP